MRKEIIAQFPAEYDRYIEGFGGAAWVLFGLEPSNRLEIYNDADSNLVNLFRCVKYHAGELQRELQYTLLSRESFENCKSQLSAEGLTDIQRAARFFVVIKESFGAKCNSFSCGGEQVAGC